MYGPADTAGLVHLQPQVMVKAGDGAVVLVDDEVGTGRAVRIVSVIGTARRSPGWGCGGGEKVLPAAAAAAACADNADEKMDNKWSCLWRWVSPPTGLYGS